MQYKCVMLGAFALAFCAGQARAAEPFDSKLQATTYKTKLVQANDECASPTTIIGGLDACAPANVATDGTKFSIGSIGVKAQVVSSQVLTILKSSGNGDTGQKAALGGKTVQTKLVLRITKRSTTTAPLEPVTWVDQTLLCAPATVTGTGNVVIKQQLTGVAGCGLSTALLSEQFEKEIVSASVIDAGSGKAIAVPGVRKK